MGRDLWELWLNPPNPICTPLIPPSFQSLLNPALPRTFWIFIAPTQTFFYCLLTSSLPSTLFPHVLQAVFIKPRLSPKKDLSPRTVEDLVGLGVWCGLMGYKSLATHWAEAIDRTPWFFSNRFEVPSQAETGTIPPPTESFSDYRIAWKELFSVLDKRKFQRTEHFVREWTRKGPLDNCLGKKGQPFQFVEVSISEVIIVCQIP